ncbi:MAG: hypothetical protein JXA43_03595 [Candidatus Diapherotrites archaeon]|nr:hypothetical protein [Candidatus Diapherotrites archaeon]
MANPKELEVEIVNTFSDITTHLGYSSTHGKILAVLLMQDKAISLPDLAKKTGYSISSISISLDFLELFGMIKKIKKSGDRKLYVELTGDLLEGLKTAVVLKLQSGITNVNNKFEKYKVELSKAKTEDARRLLKSLNKLEKELNRVDKYVTQLSDIELPR